MSPLLEQDRSLLLRVADGLDPQQNEYVNRPGDWVRDRAGEYVWSKQEEVCDSVVKNRFTDVRSAHSTGKSHIASRIVAWWQDVHPPEDTFIVTTAPSTNQVSGILWRYIRSLHSRLQLPGYITGGDVPAWKLADQQLIGWGRKPQDLKSAEQAATVFQGIHAKYLLVILDEAGGIPEWLWNAVNTLVSDERGEGRVLAIGNPDDPASYFARVASPGTKWHDIQIKAFDSPNFIGDPRYTGTSLMAARDADCPPEVAGSLVGPTFVEDAALEWGEESPLYVAKVDAEFPAQSDDTLIQMSWIRSAMDRDLSGGAIKDTGKGALDVARTGKDEAVLALDRAGMFRIIRSKIAINDTTKLILWLHSFNRDYPDAEIIIDADGVGGPVLDQARKELLPASPFYAGHQAFKPRKFVNRRSEQWWALRLLFKDGLVDIDPSDLKLQAQLGSIKFDEDSAGRVAVETKKQMRKRGLPSPDRADTLMMIHAPAEDFHKVWTTREDPLGFHHKVETVTGDLLTENIW